MNHYLPSAFDYKGFNSKILTRPEDLQKGSLRCRDEIKNIFSKFYNLCSSHGCVSSFLPTFLSTWTKLWFNIRGNNKTFDNVIALAGKFLVTVGLNERPR